MLEKMESQQLEKVKKQIQAKHSRIKVINKKINELNSKRDEIDQEINELMVEKDNIQNELKSDTMLLDPPLSRDWKGEFKWTKRVWELKKTVFKINGDFRPNQQEVINATLSKRNCFVIMPTGGGKSLCYQLPALITEGFTLVVSPLLSLIKDQVAYLNSIGVKAVSITSSTSKAQITQVMANMSSKESKMKLLYVTPERIGKSKRFMNKLEQSYKIGRLDRIVVDEAHCCSEWGHDYRTDYKTLKVLKIKFPDVPVLALTATASHKVVNDVKTILHIIDCELFKSSCNRENLFYEIRKKNSSGKKVVQEMVDWIKDNYMESCGIIYCFSKKEADNLAAELAKHGLSVASYHAGMSDGEREVVHDQWINNSIRIVVATIAFGLGINKLDVRFVIHHTLSKSIENYYQESGRAGRDGHQSHCILYYRAADVTRLSSIVFTNRNGLVNLYNLVRYSESTKCRRCTLSKLAFDETLDPSKCVKNCDLCSTGEIPESKDVTEQAKCILEILIKLEESKTDKVTLLQLVDILKGKTKSGYVFDVGVFCDWNKSDCERLLIKMLLEEIIEEDFVSTAYSTSSYLRKSYGAQKILKGVCALKMEFLKAKKATRSKSAKTKAKKEEKSVEEDLEIEVEEHETKTIVLEDSEEEDVSPPKLTQKKAKGKSTSSKKLKESEDEEEEEEEQVTKKVVKATKAINKEPDPDSDSDFECEIEKPTKKRRNETKSDGKAPKKLKKSTPPKDNSNSSDGDFDPPPPKPISQNPKPKQAQPPKPTKKAIILSDSD
uniref:ATP-dependent DNA helicase n=1 Tax=Arcella intermedia TaxID=1963864 RepID=A0A6B2KYE2_9EUKA